MPERPEPVPLLERVRQRRLLLVGLLGLVVVALCVGLLVQRASRLTGAGGTTRSSTGAPSAAASRVASLSLPNAGGAIAYLESEAGIVRVDLGTGDLVTTPTAIPAGSARLHAGPGWVIAKTPGSPNGALLRDGGAPQVLPPLLQQAGQVFVAGDEDLWALPEAATKGVRAAARVDLEGDPVTRATIAVAERYGSVVGSLGDTLVLNGRTGTYEARVGSVRRVSSGLLLAVGTDGTLTWDCDDRQRCDARTNRSGHDFAFFPGARASLESLYGGRLDKAPTRVGALSPDRRWVALPLPRATRGGSSLVLVDLADGNRIEVPGSAAAARSVSTAAFTPNSQLFLAITDGQLRVVDLDQTKVSTPDGAPSGLLHLTIAGSSGL